MQEEMTQHHMQQLSDLLRGFFVLSYLSSSVYETKQYLGIYHTNYGQFREELLSNLQVIIPQWIGSRTLSAIILPLLSHQNMSISELEPVICRPVSFSAQTQKQLMRMKTMIRFM
eukprot:302362_1